MYSFLNLFLYSIYVSLKKEKKIKELSYRMYIILENIFNYNMYNFI